MKIKGKITILFNEEKTTISLMDESSRITFAEVELTPKQLSAALGRVAYTDCMIETKGLEKIGKTKETSFITFEVAEHEGHKENERQLLSFAEFEIGTNPKLAGRGWFPSDSFGSKDSFKFNYDTNKYLVKCRIIRYV